MNVNSLALLFITLIASSCSHPQPNPSTGDVAADGSNQHVAFIKHPANSPNSRINLSGQEHSSLVNAIGTAESAGVFHIHADAANGRLVFSSDTTSSQSASHLSGNEPEISLSERGPAVKIVATPAANTLLEKRATP